MARIARLLRRRSATRERLAALERQCAAQERQCAAHRTALMRLAETIAEPGPEPAVAQPGRPRLTVVGGGR